MHDVVSTHKMLQSNKISQAQNVKMRGSSRSLLSSVLSTGGGLWSDDESVQVELTNVEKMDERRIQRICRSIHP